MSWYILSDSDVGIVFVLLLLPIMVVFIGNLLLIVNAADGSTWHILLATKTHHLCASFILPFKWNISKVKKTYEYQGTIIYSSIISFTRYYYIWAFWKEDGSSLSPKRAFSKEVKSSARVL